MALLNFGKIFYIKISWSGVDTAIDFFQWVALSFSMPYVFDGSIVNSMKLELKKKSNMTTFIFYL